MFEFQNSGHFLLKFFFFFFYWSTVLILEIRMPDSTWKAEFIMELGSLILMLCA